MAMVDYGLTGYFVLCGLYYNRTIKIIYKRMDYVFACMINLSLLRPVLLMFVIFFILFTIIFVIFLYIDIGVHMVLSMLVLGPLCQKGKECENPINFVMGVNVIL